MLWLAHQTSGAEKNAGPLCTNVEILMVERHKKIFLTKKFLNMQICLLFPDV